MKNWRGYKLVAGKLSLSADRSGSKTLPKIRSCVNVSQSQPGREGLQTSVSTAELACLQMPHNA